MNQFKNAIIYCRISSKNQKIGTSLESQKLLCTNYCIENNFDVIKTINEISTAKIMKKQKKLFEIVNSNNNINLIVYEPSRLSRNLKDFLDLFEIIQKKNIIIHIVQNKLISDNSNHYRQIISGILDGEIESKNLSLRMKRSINFKKSTGKYLPTIPKFGSQYKTIKNTKILEKNIEERNIIQLINKLYWGSDINSVQDLILKITGKKQELFFISNPDEKVTKIEYGNMKIVDIVNLLNSMSITRRNKKWTLKSVSTIINDIKKNFKSLII